MALLPLLTTFLILPAGHPGSVYRKIVCDASGRIVRMIDQPSFSPLNGVLKDATQKENS